MIDGRKNSLKCPTALILSVLLIITSKAFANYTPPENILNSLTAFQDTTRPVRDTIPVRDTLRTGDTTIRTTDTFQVNMSKDSLKSPITYGASDSVAFILPEKKIILFSQASVRQTDMDLNADSIEIDQESKSIVATFRRDSSGAMIGRPKMIQAGTTMESDIIRFNTESQKGITQNTFTKQGEIFIQGERIKKVNESDFFALRGQFTTCNLDTPHFAFRTKKMKLVNQKLAVSGPIHPEFEGVPVPIYLPFGIFPISQGRKSGLLPPQFTASEQFGLGLQGLGYYKVLSDNFDVLLRGDIYSFGGWAAYLEPTYRVRYRYNGRMMFTLQRTKILSSDPKQDFIDTRTFNINWSHSVDAKARPGTTFSASVNAGSTKFNQFVLNNPIRNFTNQLNSSITYSKTWDGKYNLTASANHSQNNNTGVVSMNLPNVSFTAPTFYPLQKKDFVGSPKWYEKLGIGLNTNFSNQISFYDSLFSFRKLLDTMQWGAQHSVPIQMSLPSLGPIQVAPGISYRENWHSMKVTRRWNDTAKRLETGMEKGFYASREVSFSIGLNTAIFGTLDKFSKRSFIRAIRHVIRPTVSLSYKPDLAKNDYYTTRVDTTDRQIQFSHFEGNVYGAFSPGRFGGISFGFDNNLEMKVRSKKDTGDAAIKKVRLIDGFGITGGYNLISDSFKLSPMNIYLRSTLFEKINITAGATLDPYQVDEKGFRRDVYAWEGGKFSPGRITSGHISVSTSFTSKPKNEEKQQDTEQESEYQAPLTMDEQAAQLDYVRNNPAEFADFNIPWSLNVSYSLSFSRVLRSNFTDFETRSNSNLSLNGDFNLTPRWKMGMNTYYDFTTKSIQMLTMFISREMHCWQLSINVTPVGLYRSFNITINPKSGLLRDLRINRTRTFYGS
jgi:LPS-assembly protein